MFKYFFQIILLSSLLLIGLQSSAKTKRIPKWSLTISNGYTFYEYKNGTVDQETDWGHADGQMNEYFSSLDLSRNFNRYEVGAKIQFLGSTFVSPFLKVNLIPISKKSNLSPSIVLGVVPHNLFGGYARLQLGMKWNRYLVLNPFVGVYGWYKINDDTKYEKYNARGHAGLSISTYF